ncbi:hypothetical protein HC251_23985 [Iamia sp. SCSIO 61187]|uniref:hypothetical protein n=1 Tax=Iamia sp. SCSIO 61187 TaxID=2722752 RepID=UPI001C634A07|nr:hypothetical protein [Iamia sp. SCSIO 61187]QYG95185.1 hypothetical protein HC251_23985 [Iamia sp. SCSIO 61187]
MPLGFLAAAGGGLWAFGLAVWFAADRLVETPTHPGAVSAVHVGMLAFLTTAVLGAVHQFAPVVGRRPLRSVLAARLTLGGMVATAWLLPSGFAHGPEALVAAGGVIGAVTVALAAWNLSGPLAAREGGVPVAGLRLSVGFLVVTVAFGVVYAFDRQTGWFPLLPHRVLAHAHLGLIGWLGLTYVAVAEKLWPMFLLAHRPRARAGAWAVGLIAAGTPLVATGLLVAVPALAWPGGVAVAAGLGCHLASLAGAVRHRRRPLELLHGFLLISAGFLVAAVVLAAAAALADVDPAARSRLVAAEVAALVGWLGLAVVGHAHKIVPFIGYSALRARGVTTGPAGRPLLFGDLFHHGVARTTLATATLGFAAALGGILAASPAVVAGGGVLLSLTGALATVNLAAGPRRVARTHRAVAADATARTDLIPSGRTA